MAPLNVAHTTPLFLGFVPSLVCALVNHMLCCLCNKHTTCPFCSTTTTQQPATGAATTPPAAPTLTTPQHHQSSTSWPLCRPAHHQVMPQPATLLHFSNNTPVWPFAPVHTHHQVCVMASPHTTQPSTTGMCICGCVWCTVVGLHTHSFCVGFTTPQTPCAGSSMCHSHTNCTTTHSLVWCTMPCNHTTHMVVVVVCGAVVGVLVGWHNLHLCLSCPPCGVLHLFLHTTTLSLHPHAHCAIHTTTTTTAPFGATLATTTSPQTTPINHTHGVWCVVLCVAHEQRQQHQHGGDWLA